jgi:hypothetical protein
VEKISQGALVLKVIEGARAGTSAADVAYLGAKADLGIAYAAIKGLSDVNDARDVMQQFGDQANSDIRAALSAIASHYADASTANSGEMIMQLVGIIDDPFPFG